MFALPVEVALEGGTSKTVDVNFDGELLKGSQIVCASTRPGDRVDEPTNGFKVPRLRTLQA